MNTSPSTTSQTERPPVVSVLGHVDHGKSTLLDYIRKTNTTENESGGITQKISSYEVPHTNKETGEEKNITFLDTPGHEAFTALRQRGTRVADVAVLVVSAEDGVKPQTQEILENIRSTGTPFVVALNKIDKEGADVERAKQSLAEHEVYVEEYGGDVPAVPVSAISGEGVPELLDMIRLLADMEELTGDPSKAAEGVVIESNIDPKIGTATTLIIKDGTLRVGDLLVAEGAYSPVRQIITFDGTPVKERSFSSPIYIAGWNAQPTVGARFFAVATKKEAEKATKDFLSSQESKERTRSIRNDSDVRVIPLIIKADSIGSVEALTQEIQKLEEKHPDVVFNFLIAEAGTISESDIQNANIDPETLVFGFNTSIDNPAQRVSENLGIGAHIFTVIYELTEWLEDHIERTRVEKEVDKEHGSLKVLKYFSSSKKGHVIGGKVKDGTLSVKDRIKLIRNDEEISQGRVKELQQQKAPAQSVSEGQECGLLIESPIEPASGDIIKAFTVVKE